jgi:hypothetical protein
MLLPNFYIFYNNALNMTVESNLLHFRRLYSLNSTCGYMQYFCGLVESKFERRKSYQQHLATLA